MAILAEINECTGCGACYNICAKGAIQMQEDERGFLHPVINSDKCVDCGMCENHCPVLHPEYVNSSEPKCYALSASDEIRKTSASGGVFPVLAQEIIKNGGRVYGAVWTDDFGVKHVGVDSLDELLPLCGSKYVQSDIGLSYQNVKVDLEAGKCVLFTGTPCEIAGLYAYLGRRYPKLYTAEVICHGTPSSKVLRKYLDDSFGIENVEYINFRDKTENGWSSSMNVFFKDGKPPFRQRASKNTFFHAFNECMLQRNACSVCPFSKLPRQADITMGDFWGYERVDPELNDQKGLSVITINSDQGQGLMSRVQSEFGLYREIILEDITNSNKAMVQAYVEHSGKKHFFSSWQIMDFNTMVEKCFEHQYDVGVVGLWYGLNYGSILTYFALYTLLRDLGYDAIMLPKPNNMWPSMFNDPKSLGQAFIKRHCNVFAPYRRQEDYYTVNDKCKDFVIGSDVVWSYPICGKESGQFFYLDWVGTGHKKIAMAASLGEGRLHGSDEYVQQAIYNLRKFDAMSVREQRSVQALAQITGRNDIEFVIDPVFICNRQIYDDCVALSEVKAEKPYVFSYLLQAAENQKEQEELIGRVEFIKEVANHLSVDCILCPNPNTPVAEDQVRYLGDIFTWDISVEDWLYYMKNCDMYIGDSYHSMCFSLIFHKPFIIIFKNGSVERFKSLLKYLDLEYRLVGNPDEVKDLDELLHRKIDWTEVDRKLDVLSQSSKEWLKKALCASPKLLAPEDYVESENKIAMYKLAQKVANLEERLNRLSIDNARLTETEKRLNDELQGVYTSETWQVGKAIMKLPRKVKKMIDEKKNKN